MDSKPSTPLSEQSDKIKKYDRQLRLWGDHGQALLEAAHVCICGARATYVAGDCGSNIGGSSGLGAEVLRSLVLPGIGKITIIDNATVTEADWGTNMFVSTLGEPRGEELLKSLLEMNPDVRGTFMHQAVEEVLDTQPHFFDGFTVVVAVNLQKKPLIDLSDTLWEANVPLVVVRSYGLVGYIRIQSQVQTIIETHPENTIPDLRLLQPFPALKEYFDSIDLAALQDKDHSHVPYVVVIYKYLQRWVQEHGCPPNNYKERKRLGEMIREGMRLKSPSDYEENFEEAIKALNTCLNDPQVPQSLQALFSEVPCPITPSTPAFWQVVAGVQAFVESNKRLPVTGVVPDMTADSASYIKLQNIYREQAHLDTETVLRHAASTSQHKACAAGDVLRDGYDAATDGRPGVGECRGSTVTEALVRSMCRNASNLRVLHGTSIADELRTKVDLGGGDMEVCDDSDVVWYVLLRAADQFYEEYGAYPGYYRHSVDGDIVKLKLCVNRVLTESCVGGVVVKDDYIHEMCRYGAAQLHCVGAFVGGCAAQEIIKLITGQYVPIDNTFLYNAATTTTTTLHL